MRIDAALRREWDGALDDVLGVDAGVVTLDGAHPVSEARRLFDAGVRGVTLQRKVDVRDAADPELALSGLVLVRELTRIGMGVDWRLHCSAEYPVHLLRHLFPPKEVTGAEEAGRLWRSSYRFGDLFYRQGPGFVHVRDSRHGGARLLTIAQEAHLEGMRQLDAGAITETLTPSVLQDFRRLGLIADVGPWAWWLPYRIQRWPDKRG